MATSSTHGSYNGKYDSQLRWKAAEIKALEIFGHFLMANHAQNENFRKNFISSKILDYSVNRCKIMFNDTLGDTLSIMPCLAIFFAYFVLSWKKKFSKNHHFSCQKFENRIFKIFDLRLIKIFFVAIFLKNILAFLQTIPEHKSVSYWGFCASAWPFVKNFDFFSDFSAKNPPKNLEVTPEIWPCDKNLLRLFLMSLGHKLTIPQG